MVVKIREPVGDEDSEMVVYIVNCEKGGRLYIQGCEKPVASRRKKSTKSGVEWQVTPWRIRTVLCERNEQSLPPMANENRLMCSNSRVGRAAKRMRRAASVRV